VFLLRSIDWIIFIPTIFLTALGSIVLSSVSPGSFPQQFIYLAIALLTFVLFSAVDIKIIKNTSPFIYVLCCILLLLTLFTGAFIRGASRWLVIGSLSIQPSEIIKPFLIVFLAHLVSRGKDPKRFLWSFLVFLPAFFLIFKQPDLGSSIVAGAGFLGVVFVGGAPIWWFVTSILLFVISTPILWKSLAGYQKSRILSFIYPAADPLRTGYNSLQAVIAIGSGQLLGRGLGQGPQSQLAFLPERHTDFIFSSLSEELGFLGALAAIMAFGLILYRIIVVLKRVEDPFSQSLLGGIFFVFFTHVVINIGMNLGILPITGIPLPFVSSGGSALISMSALLGMVSGISTKLKTYSKQSILIS